jgi:hypothetical protein
MSCTSVDGDDDEEWEDIYEEGQTEKTAVRSRYGVLETVKVNALLSDESLNTLLLIECVITKSVYKKHGKYCISMILDAADSILDSKRWRRARLKGMNY